MRCGCMLPVYNSLITFSVLFNSLICNTLVLAPLLRNCEGDDSNDETTSHSASNLLDTARNGKLQ